MKQLFEANDIQPLIEIKGLKKHFPIKKGFFEKLKDNTPLAVKAVDNVSFNLYPGETLALVGESGCGKSTTGRSLLRLIEPTEGQVIYKGENILSLPQAEIKRIRRDLQIIFQDPYASLHPRMTVKQIIMEPLLIHKKGTPEMREKRVDYLMEVVGLSAKMKDRYPHEFSGGQRQRIGIAKALALQPKIIVCDEAVSALDVSVQANIINLLKDLQQEFNLTYLFISHDLGVVKNISNRVGVMYLGKLVEIADTETLFTQPKHPYTQALLSARPIIDTQQQGERIVLEGEIPTPLNPPKGCRFNTRCPYKIERCMMEEPSLKSVANRHEVACFLTSSS